MPKRPKNYSLSQIPFLLEEQKDHSQLFNGDETKKVPVGGIKHQEIQEPVPVEE